MQVNKLLQTAILLLIFSGILVAQENNIQPNDAKINVYGSHFMKMEGNEMVLHRHSDKAYTGKTKENLYNPIKARTGSGIYIEFKTKSPSVTINLKTAKGNPKYALFKMYQNGEFDTEKNFKYVEDAAIKIELKSKTEGKAVVYRITFPLMTDIHFLGLTLEDGFKLCKLKKERKRVYVTFGDSITHGTGQKNTAETYAYQLAEKMDYELFNTAVGGGKTSQVMAEMIRDEFKKIDMITVLIGFNDYNGEGASVETYAKRYVKMLQTLREKHIETKIYCITLLTTKANNSKKSGIAANDFRKAVRGIVAKRQKEGDKNIYLIKGETITTLADLKDKVHLSVDGAKNFSEALFSEIKKLN